MTIGVHTSSQNTSGALSITTAAVVTTSGSTLVVTADCDTTFDATTPIQDSKGNTWTLRGSDQTHGSRHARSWTASNITGGSGHTITITASASGFFEVNVVEIKDVPASPSISQAQANDEVSPFNSGDISPAVSCDLVGSFFSGSFGGTETNTYGGSFSSGDMIESKLNADLGIVGSMAAVAGKPSGTYNTSVTTTGTPVAPHQATFILSVEIITAFPAVQSAFTGSFGRRRTRYAI